MRIRQQASLLALTFTFTYSALATPVGEAFANGKFKGDFRLRYENVDQNNALTDADALTLRSRLSFNTAQWQGLNAFIEIEDVRIVAGINDYSVPPTDFNSGEFSVIADPKSTEIDQAYMRWQHNDFSVKLGRQVITYDGHRYVGHVGWRQDRQTFDAIRLDYKVQQDITLSYSFIGQRNFIFADDADLDSEDHLVNIAWQSNLGKLAAYAYLLEIDDVGSNSLDTYGLSFKGDTQTSNNFDWIYQLEYASQQFDTAHSDFDADYLMAQLGVKTTGLTVALTYEALGSDGNRYGFSTPLATLHKFNGWADIFLAAPSQGLIDVSLSASGIWRDAKWKIAYHNFEADDGMVNVDDFGRELDLQFIYPFTKNLKLGIKYATYSDGDSGTGKVDTDKLWLWTQFTF